MPTRRAVLLGLTAGVAALSGCAALCPRSILIGTNHGHTMALPDADIRRGKARTYDITGDGVHPHHVTLTPEHFATLRAGGVVECLSTADGEDNVPGSVHTHTVTITPHCAAA